MALYRLSVQGIRRSEGRSTVASAAYRSGTALRDERLEMTFDFRRKEGIEHREVMGPETVPAALLAREALWNAAEKADVRKDSVPAQEVLISLPHELNAEQRRALVQTFVAESLVKRGMIADFAIHQPDVQGDQRNFHAHILVTTRDVGPEGLGKKNPDWNHASFVIELRHEWARVQNQALQQYLGPDAPQVSERSLADRGIMRAPEPKKGAAATAMERRGEHSELAARRAGVLGARDDLAAQEQAVRRQMRPEHSPWRARATHELQREMLAIKAALERNKAELETRRDALQVPRPRSLREIENGLTKPEIQTRRRAEFALKRARDEAIAGGLSARSIAKWFANPGAALLLAVAAGHRHFDRFEAADQALKLATAALEEKRAWVRSDAGQAHVSNLREPAVEASVEVAKQKRAIDRRVRRLGAQIVRVHRTIRDLSVAQHAGIERIAAPGHVPRDGTREAAQARHVAAIAGPVRAALSTVPKPLLERALRALKAQAEQPESPNRGPDLGSDPSPDI
jgi:ATP-dependent exoDNAse (exonuclease V) alpha subunit